MSVSPWITSIFSIATPNLSPTIWANVVSCPCPWLWAPVKTETFPVALNLNYYFFDETFSPFLGLGFGFENFRNSNKYVLKPVIGISNEKLKVFARFGFGNTIGSSLEIGIGYSFKERPCGCFPQTR